MSASEPTSSSFVHLPQVAHELSRWLDFTRTAWRRLLRRLSNEGGAFDVDFCDAAASQAIFEEGSKTLFTDGSVACMRPSHIQYNTLLDDTGRRGLLLTMDNEDVTCGHDAEIAVGHLASYSTYSYGDFEWHGRVHHAPDGSAPPANSFTCFSTFVHGDLPHNELAWCFPANDGREVHMSYWYDDTMHRSAVRLRFDLTQGFHTYTTRWREMGVDWLIDDVVVHQTRGTPREDVPTLARTCPSASAGSKPAP